MNLFKAITCFLFFLYTLSSTAQPQKSKQQITKEKAFIAMLNKAATDFPMNDFATSDTLATLIQPFTLNAKGEVSATWRVPTNSGFYLIRKSVALKDVKRIFFDVYIGFVTAKDKVQITVSKTNSTTLSENNPYFLFHIARVGEDVAEWHIKLQQALDQVRPYYPIVNKL